MKNLIIILVFLPLLLVALELKCQTSNLLEYVISSCGETATSSLGSYEIDFTISEPVDLIRSVDEYTVSQGYQQPEFFEITSIEENQFNLISRIYPNPFGDIVYIELSVIQNDLRFELYDTSGRIIIQQDREHTRSIFAIDMSKVPSGNYFLKIIDSVTQEYGTYIINKF